MGDVESILRARSGTGARRAEGRARVGGPRVLVGLTLLVALTVAITVTWARLTPGVPDARERRRGFALPGADPDAPPPMGSMAAPPARRDGG